MFDPKERRIVSVQPPLLRSLATDDIASFSKEYKRYVVACAKDGMEPVEIRDCVDDDTKRVLQFKRSEVLASAEAFKAYLESALQ